MTNDRIATTLVELKRDREVFARWMAEALLTLGTLTDEDSEDGGESLRMLIDRGQRLVDAVLRPNAKLSGDQRP